MDLFNYIYLKWRCFCSCVTRVDKSGNVNTNEEEKAQRE